MRKYIVAMLLAGTTHAQSWQAPYVAPAPVYPSAQIDHWALQQAQAAQAQAAYQREATLQMMYPPSPEPLINHNQMMMRGIMRDQLLRQDQANQATQQLLFGGLPQ